MRRWLCWMGTGIFWGLRGLKIAFEGLPRTWDRKTRLQQPAAPARGLLGGPEARVGGGSPREVGAEGRNWGRSIPISLF